MCLALTNFAHVGYLKREGVKANYKAPNTETETDPIAPSGEI